MALLSKGDVAVILLFKILLPTVDILTDILTIIAVLTFVDPTMRADRLSTLYIFGYLMLFFFLLSFILTIPAYWRTESSKTQKLKALPFLLLFSWPQYRAMRLLWWAFGDANAEKLIFEKNLLDEELSHIGKTSAYLLFGLILVLFGSSRPLAAQDLNLVL